MTNLYDESIKLIMKEHTKKQLAEKYLLFILYRIGEQHKGFLKVNEDKK